MARTKPQKVTIKRLQGFSYACNEWKKCLFGITSLSNPKKMIITKKKIAQSWGSGIRATARGKAMNASPGPVRTIENYFFSLFFRKKKLVIQNYFAKHLPPDSATSDISTPCSFAINPSTEKMANPATKLVRLFNRHRAMESLPRQVRSFVKLWSTEQLPQWGQRLLKTIHTCSSCCCICCSSPTMWGRQCKLQMSRKFGCQHPSTPEGQFVFGISLWRWQWMIVISAVNGGPMWRNLSVVLLKASAQFSLDSPCFT